jgi:hypothetical protein
LRLEDCSAEDFKSVFSEGVPGGPVNPGYIFGAVREDGLFMYIGADDVRIDNRPQKLLDGKREFAVDAVTLKFLIVQAADIAPNHLELNSVAYYVHDKERDTWRTVVVPGNSPIARIFESWLVTSEMYVRRGADDNPGHAEERDHRTAELPNVRQAFEMVIGGQRHIAGRLTLSNLKDGRQLTLNTGVEDSEVLDIDNDSVLYRINDSIYRAALSGNKLGTTVLLVHDDDVPEVHWVFKAP